MTYLLNPNWAAVKLALCVGILAGVESNAHAQQDTQEGMLGWWYYGGGPNGGYASNPIIACSNTAANHMGTWLVDMRVRPSWGVPAYDCKYPNMISAGGIQWYGVTQLWCKPGYVARWPGVCTKRLERPRPLNCSPAKQGYAVANPVVVSTGGKVQSETDFSSGPQSSLQVIRTYRTLRESAINESGGGGWSFSFDRRLFALPSSNGEPPSQVWGLTEDGSYFNFNYANGVYTSSESRSELLAPANTTFDEWIYKNADGRIDYFKKIGGAYYLTSSHTKEGVGQYFSYDANNRLERISDSFGRTLQVVWKNEYVVDSIIGPDPSARYEYDQVDIPSSGPIPGTARLIKVTVSDASGTPLASKTYHYEDPQNRYLLTGITDENGVRYATYAYDGFGQVVLSEHAGGADRYKFIYSGDTSRTITDPLGTERSVTLGVINSFGRVTALDQPSGAGCSPSSRSIGYDAQGNLSSSTDFNGIKSCFAFDSARELETGRIEGVSAATACPSITLTSLSEGQRKILTQWHPDQRVKVKVAEPKKITTYVYNGQPDPDGQILNCAPGAILPDGKPIAVLCRTIEQATTDDSGATGFNASPVGASRVWNYTYNGVGQLLSADGPRDDNGIIDKTTYEYYTDTTVTHTIGDLRIVTNAKGHVTEFLEYNKSGKATKIKYPNTTIAKLTYSPRGWLTSRTTGTETTGYEYDSVGQLKKVTLPDGAFLNYTYDDAHRLTRIEDGLGNSISYTLDLRGNRTSEQVRDSSGTLARQTTRVFDALNRLEQVMGGVQ